MTDIRVPTLGESITEATILKWFKKAGEAVAIDERLVELESDKATVEVPSPAAGVLSEIVAKEGEPIAVGALLGEIKEGAAACRHGCMRRQPRTARLKYIHHDADAGAPPTSTVQECAQECKNF